MFFVKNIRIWEEVETVRKCQNTPIHHFCSTSRLEIEESEGEFLKQDEVKDKSSG